MEELVETLGVKAYQTESDDDLTHRLNVNMRIQKNFIFANVPEKASLPFVSKFPKPETPDPSYQQHVRTVVSANVEDKGVKEHFIKKRNFVAAGDTNAKISGLEMLGNDFIIKKRFSGRADEKEEYEKAIHDVYMSYFVVNNFRKAGIPNFPYCYGYDVSEPNTVEIYVEQINAVPLDTIDNVIKIYNNTEPR